MHIIMPAVARAERNPPIDEVIRQNVVIPQFVAFLQRPDMPQLQFEAAWALTNVASGTSEHTKVVIDEGAVPILVQLLASPSDDVREQVGAAAAAAATPHCVTSLPPPLLCVIILLLVHTPYLATAAHMHMNAGGVGARQHCRRLPHLP